MTSTPDNAATTWRSLTDQLTPSRVDKLAEAEKRSPLPDAEKAAALLDWAAQRNLDDHLMFSHISRPAVATAVYHCGERTAADGPASSSAPCGPSPVSRSAWSVPSSPTAPSSGR